MKSEEMSLFDISNTVIIIHITVYFKCDTVILDRKEVDFFACLLCNLVMWIPKYYWKGYLSLTDGPIGVHKPKKVGKCCFRAFEAQDNQCWPISVSISQRPSCLLPLCSATLALAHWPPPGGPPQELMAMCVYVWSSHSPPLRGRIRSMPLKDHQKQL